MRTESAQSNGLKDTSLDGQPHAAVVEQENMGSKDWNSGGQAHVTVVGQKIQDILWQEASSLGPRPAIQEIKHILQLWDIKSRMYFVSDHYTPNKWSSLW